MPNIQVDIVSGTPELLQASDVSYLGAFFLPYSPEGEFSPQSWVRGSQITIAEDGRNIYGNSSLLVNYPPPDEEYAYKSIGKCTLPGFGGTAVEIGDFTKIEGHVHPVLSGYPGEGYVRIGGLLHYNGRVIISEYNYYGAEDLYSHKWMADTLDSQQDGWQKVSDGSLGPDFYSGSMCLVPPEYVAALGPAATGLGSTAVISRTSYGPSLHGFDPDDLGVVEGTVEATPIIWFNSSSTAASGNIPYDSIHGHTDAVWTPADFFPVAGIPTGFRTVFFQQLHGTGVSEYGPGTNNLEIAGTPFNFLYNWIYDPDRNETQGTHAWPYVNRIICYDLDECIAATDKRTLQPYLIFDLPELGTAVPQGGTFDMRTNRLYVVMNYGSGWNQVHVYQVGEYVGPPWTNTITGTVSSADFSVDTIDGLATGDYAIWGADSNGTLGSTTPTTVKSGGGNTIAFTGYDIADGDALLNYNTDTVDISWTGGTPSSSGSADWGIYARTHVYNEGSSYGTGYLDFELPVSSQRRKYRLWFGSYSFASGSALTVTSTISDNSAPPAFTTSLSPPADSNQNGYVTIEAMSELDDQTLSVRLHFASSNHSQFTLRAAAWAFVPEA